MLCHFGRYFQNSFPRGWQGGKEHWRLNRKCLKAKDQKCIEFFAKLVEVGKDTGRQEIHRAAVGFADQPQFAHQLRNRCFPAGGMLRENPNEILRPRIRPRIVPCRTPFC